MKPSEKFLCSYGDCDAVLHYRPSPEGDGLAIPVSISIRLREQKDGKDMLHVDLDSVDAMSFCDASGLMALKQPGSSREFVYTPAERQSAVRCLAGALKEHYGGKSMLAVPEQLVRIFRENGFHASPEKPDMAPYAALMAADTKTLQQTLAQVMQQKREEERLDNEHFAEAKEPAHELTLQTVTEKEPLKLRAKDLSELLTRNIAFAERKEKAPFYSQQALRERLSPDNIHAAALIDEAAGRPIGFVRGYCKEGLGLHISDFAIAKGYRENGLDVQLMEKALKSIADVRPLPERTFLIAGNQDEARFYQKLGFETVSQLRDPVQTEKGEFMFGLFPPKHILQELGEGLQRSLVHSRPGLSPGGGR